MPADRDASRRRSRRPLEHGRGAGFVTQKLVREGQNRVYRPTRIARAFANVPLYLGYAALAGALLQIGHSLLGVLAFLGAGSLFVGIGRHLHGFFSAGARFDPLGRRIEIPARPPFWLLVAARQEMAIRFDEVAEIEILEKEIFTGNLSDAINFELNLALKDGSRINLVSHTDDALVASEAAELSRMLGVPVFDGRQG